MTFEHEHYTSTYPEKPKQYKCRQCGKTFERAIRGFLCTACVKKGADKAIEIRDKCQGMTPDEILKRQKEEMRVKDRWV